MIIVSLGQVGIPVDEYWVEPYNFIWCAPSASWLLHDGLLKANCIPFISYWLNLPCGLCPIHKFSPVTLGTQSRERAFFLAVGCCIHHLNEIQHGADCGPRGFFDAFPSIPLLGSDGFPVPQQHSSAKKHWNEPCGMRSIPVDGAPKNRRNTPGTKRQASHRTNVLHCWLFPSENQQETSSLLTIKLITWTYRMSRSQRPDVWIDLAIRIPQDDVIDVLPVILTHNMSGTKLTFLVDKTNWLEIAPGDNGTKSVPRIEKRRRISTCRQQSANSCRSWLLPCGARCDSSEANQPIGKQ